MRLSSASVSKTESRGTEFSRVAKTFLSTEPSGID